MKRLKSVTLGAGIVLSFVACDGGRTEQAMFREESGALHPELVAEGSPTPLGGAGAAADAGVVADAGVGADAGVVADAGTQTPGPDSGACVLEKLRFKPEKACQGDGSIEFCLPKNRPDVEARARAIAPSIHPVIGGGRAKCDRAVETLFFFPTPHQDEAICAEPRGRLTPEAWAQVCALTTLPEIRAIVQTFYER